jgi:hypothetical protein
LNHLLTNGFKGKIDLAIQVTKEKLNEIQGDLFSQKAEYEFLNLEIETTYYQKYEYL